MTLIFSTYFSSKSKSQVLEILYYCSQPLHLRLIHKLSSLNIRAIDLALRELLELKIIKRTSQGGKVGFKLNLKHKDFELIGTILKTLKEFNLKKRTSTYSSKARFALGFIEDASQLVKAGRMVKKK